MKNKLSAKQYRFILTNVCVILMILTVLQLNALAEESQSNETVLVQDNTTFAIDLYRKFSLADGNLFFSPYSISTAIAMTYAGARGQTEAQMAKAMHFSLGRDTLHPAFSTLLDKLKSTQKDGDIRLHVANSIWPHQEYPFKEGFLDLVKHYYTTEITAVDYVKQTEKARLTINTWVEENTNGKITNLIRPGILSALTRLVLTNAIYFKGNWASPFDTSHTRDTMFRVTPDKTVSIPMMYQKGHFRYRADKDLQVLEIPYAGNQLSMVILLPVNNDGLTQLETQLNSENLKKWTGLLREQKVETWLPRFRLESEFRLDSALQEMGMVDAFTHKADFSGMDGTDGLNISAVLHKAFVEVNEEGTEAAAATAVVVSRTFIPKVPQFRADHPFIFLIKEKETGSILFIGRVAEPTRG